MFSIARSPRTPAFVALLVAVHVFACTETPKPAAATLHEDARPQEPPSPVASAAPATSAPPPAVTAPPAAALPAVTAITLPGTPPGVGFDDLVFAPALSAVLVPAGRTGNVDLLDAASGQVTPISGFSAQQTANAGHDFGVTSADHGSDGLFATDRTAQKVLLVDPATRKIVTSAALAASPDYVRYVAPSRQVWVTEPDHEQIEIFTLAVPGKRGALASAAYAAGAAPVHDAVVPIKGGPESLAIDVRRGRAYTHLWSGTTVAVDLAGRKVVATWPNGCRGSRGIALDEESGLLFVGCAEGKAVVLDVASGKSVSSLDSGVAGVDIIAYSPSLRHLYVPGGKSASMAILGVSRSGALSLLGTAPAPAGAHCAAADATGRVYVCDPEHGRILAYKDPHPASS